jgi:two-component system, OmpR family, phosphate regulon response regulator OmpR
MSFDGSAIKRPHILIVTDDEDLREFLAEGLVIGGFWTSTVASAVQSLEVFRLRSFDLAIVDIALGGMSALELIKRLRSISPDAGLAEKRTDIPLYALVDDPEEPAALEALRSGADGLLSPPLELEKLAPQLHEVVRRWRIAHPDRPWADELAQLGDYAND